MGAGPSLSESSSEPGGRRLGAGDRAAAGPPGALTMACARVAAALPSGACREGRGGNISW